MISYKLLDGPAMEDTLRELRLGCPAADADYAAEILEAHIDYALENPELEYAFCLSDGCLLIRLYDGEEYSFCYPIPLYDGAEPDSAVGEIVAYATKEEIALLIYDISAEELDSLRGRFCHVDAVCDDPEGELFSAALHSEVALLSEIPEARGNMSVSLGEIREADDAEYTRLCTDRETNGMWGYDYSADEPDPSPTYFRESAEGEFYRGTSLCLAIREGERFIGEAVLYYFDLMGGCECAVRLLPEYRGRGLATEALRCLMSLAESIGVKRVSASVDINNEKSVAMTARVMSEVYRDNKIVRFSCQIG